MLLHNKLVSLYSSAILLEKILLPSLPLREEIVDKVLLGNEYLLINFIKKDIILYSPIK